jgi:hypothetical protein
MRDIEKHKEASLLDERDNKPKEKKKCMGKELVEAQRKFHDPSRLLLPLFPPSGLCARTSRNCGSSLFLSI